MEKVRFFIQAWFPALIWMGIIFTLSHQSRIGISENYLTNFIFFKTLHILVYAGLFLLVLRGYIIEGKNDFKESMKRAFIISLLYAIGDEIHQSFVPTREGTIRDVFIDGIGILTAYGLTKLYEKEIKLFLLTHITLHKEIQKERRDA